MYKKTVRKNNKHDHIVDFCMRLHKPRWLSQSTSQSIKQLDQVKLISWNPTYLSIVILMLSKSKNSDDMIDLVSKPM